MKALFLASLACLFVGGCGNKSNSATSAPAAPTRPAYTVDDVSKALKDGNVVINQGTRADAQAFFQAHSEYQVCQDNDALLVAVVRNAKYDPKADDIYIVTAYRDGTIGSLDVTLPQFSVSNLASYCH